MGVEDELFQWLRLHLGSAFPPLLVAPTGSSLSKPFKCIQLPLVEMEAV